MRIFSYNEVKAEDAGEGTSRLKVRWLITKEMGAPNFAMRLFEVEPGGYSPLHKHPWEHEVFVLKGEVTVVGDGKEKNCVHDDVVFIPPNEMHQFKNKSDSTVMFLCLVPIRDK